MMNDIGEQEVFIDQEKDDKPDKVAWTGAIMLGIGIAAIWLTQREPGINIADLPSHLPKAVAASAKQAVAISDLVPYDTKIGSGVRVAPFLYLSAGHLALDHSRPSNKIVASCYPSVIDGQMPNKDTTQSSGYTVQNMQSAAIFNSQPFSQDVSLYESATPTAWTGLKIANSNDFWHGERLYMANYQPTAQGTDRDPYLERGLDQAPAIYGGVAATAFGNQEVVIDGLKSYGQVWDDTVRPGASGGGVFNSSGKLVGITVAESIPNEMSVAQAESQLQVRLEGLNPNKQISWELVQPVDQSLIKRLQVKLTACSQP